MNEKNHVGEAGSDKIGMERGGGGVGWKIMERTSSYYFATQLYRQIVVVLYYYTYQHFTIINIKATPIQMHWFWVFNE